MSLTNPVLQLRDRHRRFVMLISSQPTSPSSLLLQMADLVTEMITWIDTIFSLQHSSCRLCQGVVKSNIASSQKGDYDHTGYTSLPLKAILSSRRDIFYCHKKCKLSKATSHTTFMVFFFFFRTTTGHLKLNWCLKSKHCAQPEFHLQNSRL